MRAAGDSDIAEIVAGVCRNDSRYYNYSELEKIKEEFDIIVDFSFRDSFDRVLSFALSVGKPLVVGTSGLSDEQSKAIERAAIQIPIFRGGNFQLEVKKFIDAVVEYARRADEPLKVVETHYKTMYVLPSETAKVIVRKVLAATGKKVEIESHLEYDELINDWRVGPLHYRGKWLETIGGNVLKIADMMTRQKPGGVYDLDRLLQKEK